MNKSMKNQLRQEFTKGVDSKESTHLYMGEKTKNIKSAFFAEESIQRSDSKLEVKKSNMKKNSLLKIRHKGRLKEPTHS